MCLIQTLAVIIECLCNKLIYMKKYKNITPSIPE